MREEVQTTHLSGNGGMDNEAIRHSMPSSENAKLHQDSGKIRHRAREQHHVSKGNHLGSASGPITEVEDSGLHEKPDDDPSDILIDTEESVESEDLDLDPNKGKIIPQGLFVLDDTQRGFP